MSDAPAAATESSDTRFGEGRDRISKTGCLETQTLICWVSSLPSEFVLFCGRFSKLTSSISSLTYQWLISSAFDFNFGLRCVHGFYKLYDELTNSLALTNLCTKQIICLEYRKPNPCVLLSQCILEYDPIFSAVRFHAPFDKLSVTVCWQASETSSAALLWIPCLCLSGRDGVKLVYDTNWFSSGVHLSPVMFNYVLYYILWHICNSWKARERKTPQDIEYADDTGSARKVPEGAFADDKDLLVKVIYQ